MLFVAATAFNINQGVALTPTMVLYLLFFATVPGVVVITVDPGDPDVMNRPPRDPKIPITNRTAILLWILYGAVLFLAALVPLVAGPDEPSVDRASASMTMTFVVMGLGTVFNALTNRRDPTNGLSPPILQALAISLVPVALIVLATQLPGLQAALLTAPLTGAAMAGVRRAGAAAAPGDRSQQVDPPPTRTCGSSHRPAAFGHPEPRPRRRRSAVLIGRTSMGRRTKTMSKNKDVKTATSAPDKLKRKKYEAELATLQAELVALQEWVKATGAKICIVFEGRDTAGKGGTIKRIVERVSPRVFRVVALPAPSAREKSQMYVQRYVPHFPAAGEVIIFDRSWYNRAGVERVMGFCTPDEVTRFLETAPAFEKAMIDSGIILIKYWLEVSPDEQTRRLKSRIDDPRKIWKLSNMDLESYGRWFDYSRARDDMFTATDTAWAPWYIAHTDNKRRGRLNIISHLLSEIPYKPLATNNITLPKRQKPDDYQEPKLSVRHIPTPF